MQEDSGGQGPCGVYYLWATCMWQCPTWDQASGNVYRAELNFKEENHKQQFDGENGKFGSPKIYGRKAMLHVLAGYAGNCLREYPSLLSKPITAPNILSSEAKGLSVSRCIFGMLGEPWWRLETSRIEGVYTVCFLITSLQKFVEHVFSFKEIHLHYGQRCTISASNWAVRKAPGLASPPSKPGLLKEKLGDCTNDS